MKITRILVPASWFHEGQPRNDRAEFNLGAGPCGKTVSLLDYHLSDTAFEIVQRHDDVTHKRFIYPMSQLLGRIEIEYG